MSSANDNPNRPRKIRDGLSQQWAQSDLSSVASDDALLRLADARNAASKSANIFMLIAAASAILYLLRLEGLGSELRVGDYTLAKLPFGLFVICGVALTISTVSLIRICDSRAYDRHLILACEKRYGECDCHLRYTAFPNDNAWGEPFSQIAYLIDLRLFGSVVRSIALLVVNLFFLMITVAPLVISFDFLINDRWAAEPSFQSVQYGSIVFLLVSNSSMLLLTMWIRFSDRD